MKKNKKLLALVCCMALLVGTVGATLAWLTDQSGPVVNTFTGSTIGVELTETDVENNLTPTANSYKMVPGADIEKDPKVTVAAGSEACWVFVKVTEKGAVKVVGEDGQEITYGFDEFLTYEVKDNWKLVDGYTEAMSEKVYYIMQESTVGTSAVDYDVLVNNKVFVKPDVTKAMMDALMSNANGDEAPELSFEAYAIQQANLAYGEADTDAEKAAVAWTVLNSPVEP